MIPGTDVTVPTASRLYCQVTKIHIHTTSQLHSAEGEKRNSSKREDGRGETNFTIQRLANWTSKLCPLHLPIIGVSCAYIIRERGVGERIANGSPITV
jgi:hypothetical protein